jgi:hypothetical protein
MDLTGGSTTNGNRVSNPFPCPVATSHFEFVRYKYTCSGNSNPNQIFSTSAHLYPFDLLPSSLHTVAGYFSSSKTSSLTPVPTVIPKLIHPGTNQPNKCVTAPDNVDRGAVEVHDCKGKYGDACEYLLFFYISLVSSNAVHPQSDSPTMGV